MNILLAVDGSAYTKKMLAYLATHEDLLGASHSYTVLTVQAGQAHSHAAWGWEALTDALVATVAADAAPKVVMLWGAHAQRKLDLLMRAREAAGGSSAELLVLQSNHPSPLSATRGPVPFVGNGHFGQAQAFWAQRGHALDWSLD